MFIQIMIVIGIVVVARIVWRNLLVCRNRGLRDRRAVECLKAALREYHKNCKRYDAQTETLNNDPKFECDCNCNACTNAAREKLDLPPIIDPDFDRFRQQLLAEMQCDMD